MPRVVQTIDAKDNVPGGEYANSDEETEDSDKQLINSNTSDLKTSQAEYIDDIHQKTTCQRLNFFLSFFREGEKTLSECMKFYMGIKILSEISAQQACNEHLGKVHFL